MKESTLRLSITLAIITAVVVGLLAYVNSITKDIVAERAIKTQNEAMREVFESKVGEGVQITFEKDETSSNDSLTLYKGTVNGEVIGYAVNVSSNGYGGPIGMIVGVDQESKVTGVKIVSSSETAGLGAKASDESFISQYTGKDGNFEVVKTAPSADNQISAITGATITSKAVTDAVNNAVNAVNGILG